MNVLLRNSTAQLRPLSNDVCASNIRKSFLDYFCEKDHMHICSSPVFSLFDPTLAFINSGMNQFKDVFLGLKEPASNRVVNSQKCIRVGGKHNDLSQVGKDGSHHSFFEMLGNWSFGDYFKKEACKMSWDLLTKVYGLPPERLYVTYWAGDETMGLSPDHEVLEIWKELGINENHIVPFGASDNFWEMGSTGPCGTCTEIHYDHINGRTNAQSLVNSGNPYLTELWNLVFIEYNRKSDGSLENLKKHFVDTGMGFERLVAVCQGKTSNYDTDLFFPLFEAIKKKSGHSGYTGEYGENVMDCSYRILSDHGRMIAVALSDGMIPNQQNKVRSMIRKSLMVCEKNFKSNENLLKEVTTYAASTLVDAYPQIEENLTKIHYIIDAEADIFKKQKAQATKEWKKIKENFPNITIDDVIESPQLIEGLNYIKKNILGRGKEKIDNDDAWKLYDTLGIPAEITNKIASLIGLHFNQSSFIEYTDLVKSSIKKNFEKKFYQSKDSVTSAVLSKINEMNLESTKDHFKYDYRINNVGKYEFVKLPSTIVAIVCRDEVRDNITMEEAKDQKVGLILDRTLMCCETENQESDTGTFLIEDQINFNIEKVIKFKGYTFHFGTFSNFPSPKAAVCIHNIGMLKLDEDKRLKMMQNRTALQLLNTAIRQKFLVTGEKSSKITTQGLSVDVMFYNEPFNLNDVVDVETFVKNIIRHGVSVKRKLLGYQQFINLKDVVVIPGSNIIEPEIPVVEINSGFVLSRVHCNQAHVCNTSELKDFVVLELKTSSAYTKTIQAVTGEEAVDVRRSDEKFMEKWKILKEELLKISSDFSQLQAVESNLRNLEADVKNKCKGWVTKQTILKEMDEEKRRIKMQKSLAFKNAIRDEMTELVKSSKQKFLIHCLELEGKKSAVSLEEAIKICGRKPSLIFAKLKKKLIGQCFVPKEMANENFNAENWLATSLGSLKIEVNHREGQEKTETYFTHEKELTREEVSEALKRAENFARKYLPS